DVGMVQARGGVRLGADALELAWPLLYRTRGKQLRSDHLDGGDTLAQQPVLAFVNQAHAALSEFCDDVVVADLRRSRGKTLDRLTARFVNQRLAGLNRFDRAVQIELP